MWILNPALSCDELIVAPESGRQNTFIYEGASHVKGKMTGKRLSETSKFRISDTLRVSGRRIGQRWRATRAPIREPGLVRGFYILPPTLIEESKNQSWPVSVKLRGLGRSPSDFPFQRLCRQCF